MRKSNPPAKTQKSVITRQHAFRYMICAFIHQKILHLPQEMLQKKKRIWKKCDCCT